MRVSEKGELISLGQILLFPRIADAEALFQIHGNLFLRLSQIENGDRLIPVFQKALPNVHAPSVDLADQMGQSGRKESVLMNFQNFLVAEQIRFKLRQRFQSTADLQGRGEKRPIGKGDDLLVLRIGAVSEIVPVPLFQHGAIADIQHIHIEEMPLFHVGNEIKVAAVGFQKVVPHSVAVGTAAVAGTVFLPIGVVQIVSAHRHAKAKVPIRFQKLPLHFVRVVGIAGAPVVF